MIKNKEDIIKIIKSPEIIKLLKNNGIEHISLFGSYVNGNFNSDSDIDLLYEEISNNKIGLFAFLGLIENLEKKLGKKIDLVEKNTINVRIKDYILSSKIDIL